MFRIRKIRDVRTPINEHALEQAVAIIRTQLPGLNENDLAALPDRLENPYAHRFVTELFVAENGRGAVRGAALLLFDPELRFAFLDVIASDLKGGTGGTGGALYERLRLEAGELGADGLYFECLPDEGHHAAENIPRLKFYERFGARPINGTAYQTPVNDDDDAADSPFLMFDGLDRHDLPDAGKLRAIIRAILERKYPVLCPPAYVETVTASVKEGAYTLRPFRYARTRPTSVEKPAQRIPLIVNTAHDIHHVRERGYVESPVRVDAILDALEPSGLFERREARHCGDRWIAETHDPGLVAYLKRACAEAPEGRSVYPYVFPVRNRTRAPKERSVLAGYWCIDTFTPINANAWKAARGAVDCALTAAQAVLDGAPFAYALVRPPGHHAERATFGGFCYFCNGAIAAQFLSRYGRVAILDIDYHHGNGQQDIFYERDDVLTVSIHGDPSFAYPYFTGFADESGRGAGAGFNLNLTLPEAITPAMYHETLARALERIAAFDPAHLVISLGFDTGKGDPTGTWPLRPADFTRIGAAIAGAKLPTTIIQEGGYRVRTLGANARAFFVGLATPVSAGAARPASVPPEKARRRWRTAVRVEDGAAIRDLVAGTGFFTAEEIAIAQELCDERVERGTASGYDFVLLEEGTRLLGYACFGRTPGTESTWDLYWIAVARDAQGSGLGAAILQRAEAMMVKAGARRVFAETSTRETYAPTRSFYERHRYTRSATHPDYYRDGDGMALYRKDLP